MLKKTFEWYRMVNPNPDDETISKRTNSAQALIARIDESDSYDLLVACATGAVSGFESGFTQNSPVIDTIVTSIRANQSAFPSDLSENALELRALATIALGEIIIRPSSGPNSPEHDAVLASSLIITGSGLRRPPQERFLNIVIGELREAAQRVTKIAAVDVRKRTSLEFDELVALEPGATVATLWAALRPVLENMFSHLEEQAKSDREELQVLSWLYNNYSEKLGKPLKGLENYEIALCAGAEVADLIKVPSLDGIQNMVMDAVSRTINGEANDLSLIEMAGQWTKDGINALLPNDDAQTIVKQFPPLFPLTWLGMRIIETGSHSNWDNEFGLKTGLNAGANYAPQMITQQVFNERVAQRIYSDSIANTADEE